MDLKVAFLVMLLALPSFSAAAETTAAPPSRPLSFKECGAKYRAAKADDTLQGRKWLDYRRSVCGIRTKAQTPLPRPEAASVEALRRLAFPVKLASEFSKETDWKARMRTCLKSYREQKKAGTLYGVKWVEKGGGYYSLCSAKLRGALAT